MENIKTILLKKYKNEENLRQELEDKIINGNFITTAECLAIAKYLGYEYLVKKYECYIECNTQYGEASYDAYVSMISDIYDDESIILNRL